MNIEYMQIVLPCIAICGDILSGFVAAYVNNCVDSELMKKGIFNKVAELFTILVGFFIQYSITIFPEEALGFTISSTIPIGTGVCAYVLVTEIVSIIENIGLMNPELGKKLSTIVGISPTKVYKESELKEGDKHE